MAHDSARNATPDCLYSIGKDGKVREHPVTRRTPKRVYFKVSRGWETYIDRAALERDGKVTITGAAGLAEITGGTLYASPPRQALAVTTAPVAASDSAGNDDGRLGELWQKLSRADWSSSAAAYATAADARTIITATGMTIAAFAAECRIRRISGFGSQASVSRRLRWAELHDQLWNAGILPRAVYISEAASRPLFDGKLTAADRLKLLAELFGSYLTDEQKQRLAEQLNEAMMREHLAGQGHDGEYKAPRQLVPEKVIARLLTQGLTADRIAEIAHHLEDSARNAAA